MFLKGEESRFEERKLILNRNRDFVKVCKFVRWFDNFYGCVGKF